MNEVQCLSGCSTADSFALAGRLLWPTHTQGVALDYKLAAPTGRAYAFLNNELLTNYRVVCMSIWIC